ncbi:hypothetical protein DL546_005344 [Coniochaeta pulveracea]|uniref:Uncharacterized protein n=1 Tax=Coniochaeta pulveracea TaxID=177199 RepID=A0A420Y5V7_9PEZI|nr:hypothetical protein DL546_005344 [Coniochaeta pulveracea]
MRTGDSRITWRRPQLYPIIKTLATSCKGFVDGYTHKFGKRPFLHRALRWRWEQADKLTPEERDEGWERIYTYRQWLLNNVFSAGTVVVLPIDDGTPNSRENPPPPFGLLNGYHPLSLSPIAGTPEVTRPIGEITYRSDVTQLNEPLPISVSVVT